MNSSMAILTDVTKCIGCEECVKACKHTNNTGEDLPWRWQQKIDDLSATRFTTILRLPDKHYVRQQCRHCLEPACVSACPVGAMYKTPEGAVVYNSDICIGCRYCMTACPFGIPRYSWSKAVHYVRKCFFCHQNIMEGKQDQPACTRACPTKATVFGERDKLIKIARQRIEEGKDKYIDHIWGEKEVGGTSVLYISDVSLGFLGLKEGMSTDPLPLKTWEILRNVPGIFLTVGAGMYGLHWIIDRRERLKKENAVIQESKEGSDE